MSLKTMKKITFLIVLVLALNLIGCAIKQAPKTHQDLKFPKLRKIEIPEIERRVLSNGMVLFLLEDHRLPLINARILIKTGSVFEPADKAGLAGITGQVLRTGGTKSKTGEEINEELENIAASVETGISMNSGFATMSTLKEDVDKSLAILVDILMNPAFKEDKLDLAKVQARSIISRRNDEPFSIANREFDMLIYGKESPYARVSEYDTINNIKQEDLFAFHQKFFHPNNCIMGIWGDFDKDEMAAEIEKVFKNWKKTDITLPQWPKVNKDIPPSVNYVEKKDLTQSYLSLGHLGIKTENPDYFALQVMNYIFGQGGFTSRLVRKIRSDMGLTYGISGGVDDQFNYPGIFSIGTFTKSESTVKAISAITDEIKLLIDKGVTQEELDLAKESYFNKYVFRFDTKGEIVARKMAYEYYGLPLDFLEKSREKIEQVTVADVNEVAKKYLHPDKLVILVVGKAEDFDQPLSTLGKVNTVDITIKEPTIKAPAIPPATPESIKQAKDIMLKVAEAMGGFDKIKNLKSQIVTTNNTVIIPQGGEFAIGMKIFGVYPDKVRLEMNTPMGKMSLVLNGEKAWVESPQGVQNVPVKDFKKEQFRDLIEIIRNLDNEAVTFQYLGEKDFQGQKAHAVYVFDNEGNKLILYIDKSSLQIIGEKYTDKLMMLPPGEVIVAFNDYKEIDGIKFAFTVNTTHDGKQAMKANISEIQINKEIDPALFEKKEK